MRHFKPLILLLFCGLILPSVALAAVDFTTSPPIETKQPIKAMAPSFDGSMFFVLGQDSTLYLYNAKGEKQGETKVDSDMDMIATSGFKKANIPESIVLSSSTTGAIQRVKFEKTIKFDLTGSPFIGKPNAEVAVVIFSDFQ